MSDRQKDILSSLIFLLIGIGVLISTSMITDPGISEMGPKEFPRFIGICMVVLSLILFAKTLYSTRKEKENGSLWRAADSSKNSVEKSYINDEIRGVLIAAICLAYAIAFTSLGYFISTFLAITAICILFREKRIWVYPILYAVAVLIWAGFTFLLSIRLP